MLLLSVTRRAQAHQRKVVGIEDKTVALSESLPEHREDLVRNLKMLAALLTNQVVMMISGHMVLIAQLTFDGNRCDQSHTLEPLQRPVHSGDREVGLLRHDRGVDFLGGGVMAMGFNDLQYLQALGRETMPLLSQEFGFFKMHRHALLQWRDIAHRQ